MDNLNNFEIVDNRPNKATAQTLIKNNTNENTKMLFMITDVFLLNGKSVINMNYKKKMLGIKPDIT